MQPPLSPIYYLDHFHAVLHGVLLRYGPLLNNDEYAYIAQLQRLPQPVLCLYVRLLNRRGPCFRVSKLAYDELPDIQPAIEVLIAVGLVHLAGPGETLTDILDCFTHAELRVGLPRHGTGRKPELVAWIVAWEDRAIWLTALLTREAVISLPQDHPWPFLRFLFFGAAVENLSDFVTQALGHVVREAIDPAAFVPFFSSRTEAEDSFHMSRIYAQFRQRRVRETPNAVLMWWRDSGIERLSLSPKAHALHDRLIERLGRLLERAEEDSAAEKLYADCPVAPIRERQVRLLLKNGRREEAAALCQTMLATPQHAEEAYMARFLLERATARRRSSPARRLMKDGPLLELDHADYIEGAVLAAMHAEGWQGVHSENWVWNALFGLLLWEAIYDPQPGAFVQPLQIGPSDLHHAEFYTRRAALIERDLERLHDAPACLAHLQERHAAKHGTANPFVSWHAALPPLLEAHLHHVPPAASAAVLRHFAQDVKRRKRGFPDLFLWRDGACRFVEVKSPTDQLSPGQYHWLRFFADAGLDVVVQRVRWKVLEEV